MCVVGCWCYHRNVGSRALLMRAPQCGTQKYLPQKKKAVEFSSLPLSSGMRNLRITISQKMDWCISPAFFWRGFYSVGLTFFLYWFQTEEKKNGACHRSPEMFPQLQFYLVVPLTPQDTMGSASDIQRLCFSRKELLGNEWPLCLVCLSLSGSLEKQTRVIQTFPTKVPWSQVAII